MGERGLKRFLRVGPFLAIAWSCFQLYVGVKGFMDPMILYPVHTAFAVCLAILSKPLSKTKPILKWLDALMIGMTICAGIYAVLNSERISTRIPFVDNVTTFDCIAGVSIVLLVLESCRRLIGISLTTVALFFIAYAFAGKYIPGILGHRGLSFDRFIDLQILSPNGIYGIPIGVSATLAFYFILFGAFLEEGGGGKLFTDLGFFFGGRVRGGAAKIAVIASALYGTVSGSAVANVVLSGTFTIPMMKRHRFHSSFAGAVEAVASTGGQLMPPIMGAAAFIIAQLLGISYWRVVLAAGLPAILFYLAVFMSIDFTAQREGIKGLSKSELPDVKTGLLTRIHLLVPLVVLVYYIMSLTVHPATAALRAIIAVIIISFLRKATWLTPQKLLGALERGARGTTIVAVACAVAGIVIGVVIYSGLGLKFTSLMIYLSGGKLSICLILVMLGAIVLGMGIPTTAAYLITVILMGPVLIKLGVTPLAAHMFIFYFAVLSMITPPVAIASFAAASIAKSSLWETCILAFKIALPGFLIPYVFVLSPALLLEGSLWDTVWSFFMTSIGIVALSGAIIGFFWRQTKPWERLALFLGALLLISADLTTDVFGIGIVVTTVFIQHRRPAEQFQGPLLK